MAPIRRRNRGLQRAGSLPPQELPMPRSRSRELLLVTAWRDVAGPAVAERAPVLGLRGAVLELRLPHGEWGRALRELIPRLAARFAARHPELGVRRYRLRAGDGGGTGVAEALPEATPDPAPGAPARATDPGPLPEPEPARQRLERAMARYLARSGRQKP